MKPEDISKLIKEHNPRMEDQPLLLASIEMTATVLGLGKKEKKMIYSLCDMVFSGGKVAASKELIKLQKLIMTEAKESN